MYSPNKNNTSAPYEEPKTAGGFARNIYGTIVAAWDERRAPKGNTHEYFCSCSDECGASVALKRGEKREAHFAYIQTNRDLSGCSGTAGCSPEAKVHYDAKWLLHDDFQSKVFRDWCTAGLHVLDPALGTTYTSPPWTAAVEAIIPHTNRRRADVLLTNSSTGECVALEVYNTHAVDSAKLTECNGVGVKVIELGATQINSGVNVLDNKIRSSKWTTCLECVQDEQIRAERAEHFARRHAEKERVRLEQDEIDRVFKAVVESERQERYAVERAARDAVECAERVERERIWERQRQEREASEATQRRPNRGLRRPLTKEERRVQNMRNEYIRMGIPIDW